MTEGPKPLRQFAEDTWPDERELARMNQQLTAVVERHRAPTRSLWWIPLGAGLLAAAALIALTPSEPTVQPAVQPPLAMHFESSGQAVESHPTERVTLATNGVGQLSGTPQAPVIDLSSGSVKVQVEPNQGIDLRVRTPDGEVQVIGTIFSVDRSALGTAVSVERGKVAVRCTDGTQHAGLLPGESALCLPTTPEGLLGRAVALRESGANNAEVSTAIDAGLSGATGSTRAELLALRMDQALQAGEHAAALEDAKAYLDSGESGRREHALRVAARLSATQSCEAAAPFLSELRGMGEANPEPELTAHCPGR